MSRYMQVLDWVNDIRRGFELDPIPELIPGWRGNPNCCVIANSLKCGLHSTHPRPVSVSPSTDAALPEYIVRQAPDGTYVWAGLPAVVNDFAVKFDDGLYPDLEA